jgi:integrase
MCEDSSSTVATAPRRSDYERRCQNAVKAKFATGKGTPIDAQNIINWFFKPLLKRAELPDIRWHDLRHTYATLLLARSTHPTYVQKSLGHASVQLTLDRYSHWMPSMGRNTAEGIDEALG